CQLYWKGYMEVPSNGPCGPCGCGNQGADGGVGPNGQSMPFGYPSNNPEGIAPGNPTPATAPSSSNAAPSNRTTSTMGGAAGMNRVMPGSVKSNPQNPSTADSRYNPSRAQDMRTPSGSSGSGNAPGLIGPVGYDVLN